MKRLAVYLLLLIGSLCMIFPFIWLFRGSFMNNAQLFAYPPEWVPKPFEWRNYSEALTTVPFFHYFINTMKIELFVVSGLLFSSSLAGYSFARLRWPGRNLMFGLVLVTLMMPYAVTLIPTFMLWRSLHTIDTYIPLALPSWFGAGTWGAFNVFLLRQFFLSIPKELDEAGYMDGATPLTVLWRVVLPLSKPALIVVGIFSFINVWNDFLAPTIYLSSESHFTLALGLAQFKGAYTGQWGYLMAASATVIAPIIVLFFLAQRFFVEGITMTGIKG